MLQTLMQGDSALFSFFSKMLLPKHTPGSLRRTRVPFWGALWAAASPKAEALIAAGAVWRWRKY